MSLLSLILLSALALVWALTITDVLRRHYAGWTALGWIALVVVLPFIGSLIYWPGAGRPKPSLNSNGWSRRRCAAAPRIGRSTGPAPARRPAGPIRAGASRAPGARPHQRDRAGDARAVAAPRVDDERAADRLEPIADVGQPASGRCAFAVEAAAVVTDLEAQLIAVRHDDRDRARPSVLGRVLASPRGSRSRPPPRAPAGDGRALRRRRWSGPDARATDRNASGRPA
jgi:hypothetical protein